MCSFAVLGIKVCGDGGGVDVIFGCVDGDGVSCDSRCGR